VVTIAEVENQAMQLPESDRAALAARLLDSLPAVLADDDFGTAEAMRRDAEMDLDPSTGMTLEQLKASLGR
jgi:putative addiction module component (TIGR02574 family)